MYFEKLWTKFSKLQEVEAIVLGGSRAMDNFDEKSDYDLYIYCSEIPAINVREQILTSTCNYMELGNHFWELEDDCTLKDGVDIDILYRNLDTFTQEVSSVVESFHVHNGYIQHVCGIIFFTVKFFMIKTTILEKFRSVLMFLIQNS